MTATYTLVVCAREHGSTVAYAAYNTTIYAVIPFTPPTIASFYPTSGGPGTVVSIIGSNFTGTTAVAFGGTAAASFTVMYATTISATAGSGATGTVTVTTPGGTASSSGTFTFIPAPTITAFTPSSGGAGAVVTITGTNFTGATVVKFGATAAASFSVTNATTIDATVGNGTTGTISVTTPGGTVTSTGTFSFIPAPIVTSYTPTSGSPGTEVTITGTNFTGATAVAFGGTSATSFTITSSTSITATVSGGATGAITVTTPGGTASSTGTFTFIPAPIVAVTLNATPNSPVNIGTPVSLYAVAIGGYAPEYKFYALYPLNGVNQEVLIQDYALSCTCTWVPALPATYTLVVCAREHGSMSAYDAYGTLYGYIVNPLPAPTLTSFTPAVGPVGQVVTLSGTYFTGANAVLFNGVAAASYTVVNDATLTATVPIGAITGPISVTTPSGTAMSTMNFYVANNPIDNAAMVGCQGAASLWARSLTTTSLITVLAKRSR